MHFCRAILLTITLTAFLVAKGDAFVGMKSEAIRLPAPSGREQSESRRFLLLGDDDLGSSSDFSDDDNGESTMFSMASLNSRLKEVQEKESKLPLVVLDSMLPRQVLELQVNNDLLIRLIRDCLEREAPFFGMIGIARLANGQQVHLNRGVEVEILEDRLQFLPEGQGVKLALKATGRRFEIENGGIETVGGEDGYTSAKVQFLDSAREEDEEVRKAVRKDDDDYNAETEDYDRMSVARAIMKAEEFTSPNMNMADNLSLVDRWIELARERERATGQIDGILKDLGTIPPADQPSERAFWIGALINPIPAMGVSLEIRPALLTARKAEQRVEVALNGILRSIKYMEGSARLV
mmetsp:Transcript_839/g.1782  ORF Transcript_839/g.1782 Transcript_839/m.1782 type:complete len:352 (-) Transcript_839:609-1664(-)|eukprot:CAMPEP_0172406114 /NCGR_PEP_ID=MMETSP1061-20121228/69447_1 /TAXON_ID=37318 /ORGANISM="Pseudo-nitzschia pungens, Strain cf. pungens" /LENGTH=351 /DNA_ID=CAMNT_0013141577 /DNA_START=40 /DNA_END=1095 /DNA_ORIENTATION=+